MTRADNLRGAGLMTLSMACFVLNDALVKLVAESVPMFQVVALRGVLTTALLLAVGLALGGLRLPKGPDRGRVAMRVGWEVAAMVPFFLALTNMPLANVTAILAALPLTVTLAAAVVFGEPVGWRRMTAVAVGFGGVLMIVQPGTEGFTVYSLAALAAVGCVTARDLTTRRVSPAVPSLTVALLTAAAVGLAGAALAAPGPWVLPDTPTLGVIAAASVAIIGAYLCSVAAIRVGEMGFTASFRYTSLVWALGLGWLLFGDWPDPLALAGAGVVAATGLLTLWRTRAAPPPVPATSLGPGAPRRS